LKKGSPLKKASPLSAIFAAFIVAIFIKLFLFDFMIAEGASMLPTIRDGDILIVYRLAYGFCPWAGSHYHLRWARPKLGDVVVFKTPQGKIAVKRCGDVFDGIDGIYFTALGDNSVESYDSRSYGPVPVDSIIGKAVGVK
jgi:signal peptidase I